RAAAFGFELLSLRIIQFQSRAIVDGRQSAGELALALAVELILGLVAGIEAPFLLQQLSGRLIARHARGLAFLTLPDQPEPAQVLANALGESFRRSLHVRVVEPQPERAAVLSRKQPVENSRADVADVQAPRGARREADGDRHCFAARSGSRRGSVPPYR